MYVWWICCAWYIETLWTFTANIRLHTFMTSKWMLLQFTTCNELLLTNVTCEPSTFIVWLQQMCLELVKTSKTDWTVSTYMSNLTSRCHDLPPVVHVSNFIVYCCSAHCARAAASCLTGWNFCDTENTSTVCLPDGRCVRVAASCRIGWSICHTLNTCTVCLPCGHWCDDLGFQSD